MKIVFVLTFFVVFRLADTWANPIHNLAEKIQRQLDMMVDKYDIPGITASVVFNSEERITLAAGYNDLESQKKMLPDNRMFSGSVGKTFVSAIALKLAENGQLALDRLILDYLSEFEWITLLPNHQTITVRDLMQHTSGLPRYILQEEFINDLKANPLADRTPEDCISYVLGKSPLHPSGKGWAYSDTNYLLLGMIIEEVTGKSYISLLSELLEELELDRTVPSVGLRFEGLSQGYVEQNLFGLPKKILNDGELVINPAFEWTGGGLVTHVEDLALWMKMLHEGKVLSDSMYSLLINPVHMVSGQPFSTGYGLGSFIWAKNSDEQYGHSGFFPGHVTHVEYSNNKQYALAIQVNSDGASSKLPLMVFDLTSIIDSHLTIMDQTKILENFKLQENCWNRNDIDCYMRAYRSDNLIQTISRGGVTFGYEKIRSNYEKNFPADNMGRLFFDEVKLSRWSDKHYFVTGRFNLKFEGSPDLIQGWFSATFERVNGQWFMITDHSS